MKIHPLRIWRFRNGISLTVLGARAKVSAGHISDIETGHKFASENMAGQIERVCRQINPHNPPTARAIRRFWKTS
jgi:transcriptional regulator with XRE-family HTH domain